jgi:hypothetical protein
MTEGEDAGLYVFDPAVLGDWFLVSQGIVIHADEIEDWDSTELAWQISLRVLSVQRWSRYLGISTHTFATLAGLVATTRR